MSYDFPASPTEDQEYVPPVGGQTYVYKAPRWLVKGIPPSSAGGGGGGIAEAPVDGQQYGRKNAAWTTITIPAGDWDSITGKPITFPPTVPIAWTDVSGKPLTYPPALPIAQSGITNLTSDQAAQDTAIGLKAPIASPTFTGDPKAPTPTAGDNDTSIATTAFVTAADAFKVAKAGDTMTGDLTIGKATPSLVMDKATAGQACVLAGRKGGLQRWDMQFGNTTAEAGANAGSDFAINSYSDAGGYLNTPLAIVRSTGAVNFASVPTINYLPMVLGATISDTAPATPAVGQFWFESDTGILFVYYNDGNSSQWVPATVGTAGPPGPPGSSAWTDLTGVPATFPPSTHTHAPSDITNLYVQNSVVYDPANLTTGSVDAIQTLTVTGAAVGDFAQASFSVDLVGLTLLAWVSAANTVKFQFQNKTAGTQNLASGTVRVRVWKQ